MTHTRQTASVRVLPDEVANKIAAGEVVERPASVVKELVENALDAGATRITVRLVAAGRNLIDVQDNGHGMTEQNALLAVERHATSKIRNAQDLDNIQSLGFRGEALASIAAVSRFVLTTRRAGDDSATQLRIDGGVLREVQQLGAPEGTRITVNRLYFNTPVRAKFLKGITTELGHSIDIVQRHALSHPGVAFQFFHNERLLLDVPAHAELRDRIALIWGLSIVRDMVEISGELNHCRLYGLAGLPGLSRASRSHQLFFVNGRPVNNRSLQYGFEAAYRSLLTVGRHPMGVLMLEINPRQVDVNIHPTKREIRFRDERAMHDTVRDIVRRCLREQVEDTTPDVRPVPDGGHVSGATFIPERPRAPGNEAETKVMAEHPAGAEETPPMSLEHDSESGTRDLPGIECRPSHIPQHKEAQESTEPSLLPVGFFKEIDELGDAPLQLFDTYLLAPDEDRLLIIDQHALHERLNYEALVEELNDTEYASQQLAVPVIFEVAPSQVQLVESKLRLFSELGVEIESFGGNTFQITAVCHLYNESDVPDLVLSILDELAQGNLFDKDHARTDLLRLATRACKASVKAGDRLTPMERRNLLAGFKRLQPPYTCPHGRPIIIELTQRQMEKSFRRIQ